MKYLTVDQCKKAGVTTVTIRFYERNGLLPKASRSAAGYRLYTSEIIERLTFIKNCQSAGLSLQEITELLKIIGQKHISAHSVKKFLQQKIDFLGEKISSLQQAMTTLNQLQNICNGKMTLDCCPIIKTLTNKPSKKDLGSHEKGYLKK